MAKDRDTDAAHRAVTHQVKNNLIEVKMLRTCQASCISIAKINRNKFQSVLGALRDQGWIPAALESERRFAELAGVTDISQIRSGRTLRTVSAASDIFFRGD